MRARANLKTDPISLTEIAHNGYEARKLETAYKKQEVIDVSLACRGSELRGLRRWIEQYKETITYKQYDADVHEMFVSYHDLIAEIDRRIKKGGRG